MCVTEYCTEKEAEDRNKEGKENNYAQTFFFSAGKFR